MALSIKNDDVFTRANEYRFNATNNPEQFRVNNTYAEWRTHTRTHTLQNTFRFGASKLDVRRLRQQQARDMEDRLFIREYACICVPFIVGPQQLVQLSPFPTAVVHLGYRLEEDQPLTRLSESPG